MSIKDNNLFLWVLLISVILPSCADGTIDDEKPNVPSEIRFDDADLFKASENTFDDISQKLLKKPLCGYSSKFALIFEGSERHISATIFRACSDLPLPVGYNTYKNCQRVSILSKKKFRFDGDVFQNAEMDLIWDRFDKERIDDYLILSQSTIDSKDIDLVEYAEKLILSYRRMHQGENEVSLIFELRNEDSYLSPPIIGTDAADLVTFFD